MDDEEFVKQLLEEFDKEFWEAMEKIRVGLKTGELEETKIAAHSIKGSAAVFGATDLSEAAKVLEHALKNGETECQDDLTKMADKIESCFKSVDRESLASVMM
ncbi:signal transduction histidine kinase [Chloropicon primus]|uniref:Signal transduction histidine kinase n=1 Tax=Chloropicon primus TaxID=1764295 RepID=A0A5B8MAN4_9CHLO|nr:signal transduction histidine kinase [Chloropicon primus]UPQ96718.1 signal transduction histidine kinase [Chloropicon primus]|eukprot:QDZ17498.1 signal transduction histidine kinase [Chloropicon primus]